MKTASVGALLAMIAMGLVSAPASSQARAGVRASVRVEPVEGLTVTARYGPTARVARLGYREDPRCRVARGHGIGVVSRCRNRSFGRTDYGFYDSVRWDRVRWGHVRLHAPRGGGRVAWLPAEVVLDRRIVERLYRHGSRLGLRGALSARFVYDRRGEVTVEIRSGRFIFAEMTDYDRDGRADLIVVARA